MQCERCGKRTVPSGYEMFDYCAECSRNLCEACMERGCCGNVPAKSGMEADLAEPTTPAKRARNNSKPITERE